MIIMCSLLERDAQSVCCAMTLCRDVVHRCCCAIMTIIMCNLLERDTYSVGKTYSSTSWRGMIFYDMRTGVHVEEIGAG